MAALVPDIARSVFICKKKIKLAKMIHLGLVLPSNIVFTSDGASLKLHLVDLASEDKVTGYLILENNQF